MHRTTIAILMSLLFVGLTLTPVASADPLGADELSDIVVTYAGEMVDALMGGGGVCISANGYATAALKLPDASGDTVVFFVPVGIENADPSDLVFRYQVVAVELQSQECDNAAAQMSLATQRFALAVWEWTQERATFHPGQSPI